MGLPLSPSFAKLFMSFMENKWLNKLSLLDFKPMYYRRYVDDLFLLLKSEDQIINFINYLNNIQNQLYSFSIYPVHNKQEIGKMSTISSV